MFRLFFTLLLLLQTTGCAIQQQNADNHPVRLFFYNELNVIKQGEREATDCVYLGPVVSSEGHWYNFLFITNANLTYGAINDMLNKSNRLGANLVYVHNNINFSTSVTLLGQAYRCPDFTAPPLESLRKGVLSAPE